MRRTVGIGNQSFDELRERRCLPAGKPAFVRDWWESGDVVTLVCRPRRFGKTPGLSMAECSFSTRYAGRGVELLEGSTSGTPPGLATSRERFPPSEAPSPMPKACHSRICPIPSAMKHANRVHAAWFGSRGGGRREHRARRRAPWGEDPKDDVARQRPSEATQPRCQCRGFNAAVPLPYGGPPPAATLGLRQTVSCCQRAPNRHRA